MTICLTTAQGGDLDWFALLSGLFGGLALFLAGMDQLAKGLQSAAGDRMRVALGSLTRNRVRGALTGAGVTAILNSSSVTTVLVVGFVTAGMMTLSQSIGVIMGANVGSTLTAQIVAFNATRIGLPMLAVGFAMLFFGKRDRVRHFGAMIMGLGLVFFGMSIMSAGMAPLRTHPPFLELMARLENPLFGIVVGAVFTGLVQSSAATTGLAVIMASDGLMTLPAGISLALGANIGTCVTALLASLGKPVDARRAAVAHILFNVLGVLIWVWFVEDLAALAEWLTADVPRQIASAHTIFNIANTLLFLGFTTQFARLVERLVPDRPSPDRVVVEPKFLDGALVGRPTMALQAARLEVGRVGDIASGMVRRVVSAFAAGTREELDRLAAMDDPIDILHDRVIEYLGAVRRTPLSDRESEEFVRLMSACDNFESIGDIVETDLVGVGVKFREAGVRASQAMTELMAELVEAVAEAVDAAARAVRDRDETAAQEVLTLKGTVDELMIKVGRHQAERLSDVGAQRTTVFRLEMTFVEALKHVHTLAKRAARTVFHVPE